MANSRRILVVEDDADMREALVEQLALHDEFEAVAVDTGIRAVQSAKAGEVDLARLGGLHRPDAGVYRNGLELVVQRQLLDERLAHVGIVLHDENAAGIGHGIGPCVPSPVGGAFETVNDIYPMPPGAGRTTRPS